MVALTFGNLGTASQSGSAFYPDAIYRQAQINGQLSNSSSAFYPDAIYRQAQINGQLSGSAANSGLTFGTSVPSGSIATSGLTFGGAPEVASPVVTNAPTTAKSAFDFFGGALDLTKLLTTNTAAQAPAAQDYWNQGYNMTGGVVTSQVDGQTPWYSKLSGGLQSIMDYIGAQGDTAQAVQPVAYETQSTINWPLVGLIVVGAGVAYYAATK